MRSPLRRGWGKENRRDRLSWTGASAFFIRPICFSLLCAWRALVFLARNRSTKAIRRLISFCWFLQAASS